MEVPLLTDDLPLSIDLKCCADGTDLLVGVGMVSNPLPIVPVLLEKPADAHSGC